MDDEKKNGYGEPEEPEADWIEELLRDVEKENQERNTVPAKSPEETPASAPVETPRPVRQEASRRQAAPLPEAQERQAAPSQADPSQAVRRQAPPPANPGDEEPPRRNRRPKRIRVKRKGKFYSFLYVLIVLAICGVIAVFCLNAVRDVLAISKPDQAVTVTVPKDSDADEIGKILKEKGLVEYPFLFKFIAQYEKLENFQSGSHVLNNNMDYMTLIKAMQVPQKSRETVMVTIPEGLPIQKIGAILAENGVVEINDFLNALKNTDFGYGFEKEIPSDPNIFYRMEGYLFPDTYEFYKNDNVLNVIKKMMDNFDKKITPEIQAQMKLKGMTLHEMLTLASIIQAEAPDEENMLLVSEVYQNRLENAAEYPLLQADPTRKYADEQVLAALGDEGKKKASLYNTYESKGLPPGPINNPGSAAINAALNPAQSEVVYYYFCSDLKTRKFYYAETLEEHNKNLVKAHLR